MPKYPRALESLPVGVEEEIDWSASEVCSMMVVVGDVDGDDDEEEDFPFCVFVDAVAVFIVSAVIESSTSFIDWIESVRDGGFGRRNNLISILREEEEAGNDTPSSSSSFDGIANIIVEESSPSSSTSSSTSPTTFQGFKCRGADSNGIHPPELSRDS